MTEPHGVSIVSVRFEFEHDRDKVTADIPAQAVGCIGDLSNDDVLLLRDLCKHVRGWMGEWSGGGEWVTERVSPRTSVTRFKRKGDLMEGRG